MMSNPSINWENSRALSSAFTHLDKVESTNTWLMEKKEVTPAEMVLSLNQSNGRGRWDRHWENEPGEGLALSVVLPQILDRGLKSPSSTWTPLLVGAAVVLSVRSIGVREATLKWPNDVLVAERKLAGVLYEVRTDGFVVAGVGVNVRFCSRRPAPRAVSLHDVLENENPVLDNFVAGILRELLNLLGRNWDEQRDAVNSVMGTIGKRVEVVGRDGSRCTGLAEGLDDYGGLIVRFDEGNTVSVTSADVEHLYQ